MAGDRLKTFNLQWVEFRPTAVVMLVSYKYTFAGWFRVDEDYGIADQGVRSAQCSQGWCFEPRFLFCVGRNCLLDYYCDVLNQRLPSSPTAIRSNEQPAFYVLKNSAYSSRRATRLRCMLPSLRAICKAGCSGPVATTNGRDWACSLPPLSLIHI